MKTFENIPAELKVPACWVIWGVAGEGKTPRSPRPPYTRASVADLLSWGTFDEAIAAIPAAAASGVGYVLADDSPYVAVDLDHCRDPATGAIEDWALKIVTALHSFTEISPSGTGLHIWVRAVLPAGGNRRGRIEMYSRRRYMTVTGVPLEGTPKDIQDRYPELAELHRATFWSAPPPQSPSDPVAPTTETPADEADGEPELPDDELLEKARASAHGDLFAKLWAGDDLDFPSPSEADASFFLRLAFWTNGNVDQMERLARMSGRVRPKWGEPRNDADWLTEELERAAKKCGPGYRAGAPAYDGNRYQATPLGMFAGRAGGHGGRAQRLTNFVATISAEIVEDDGLETRRLYEVRVEHLGQLTRLAVPAADFAALRWVPEKLPATATIYAGYGVRGHVEVAIRQLSEAIATRRVLRHTGWARIGGDWGYAHAGGLVWRGGLRTDVEVQLAPPLERFVLPAPPTGSALASAIRAHLDWWDLGPAEVSIPLAAGIWRATLGEPDFSIAVGGGTGVFKTEEAALAQQHFGPGFDARHLPAGWASTANALEALAFEAKDAVLVVDDFAPTGAPGDVQALHRSADRLLRAQGNRTGRGRLRADSTMRPTRFPRGLILMTGEDIPAGQSLRARLFILQLSRGDISPDRLRICQAAAARGAYAEAASSFLAWLAPRYEGVLAERRLTVPLLRDELCADADHRRTPAIVADLVFAIRLFLRFASETGAVSADDGAALDARATKAILAAADRQTEYQRNADPASHFCELLRAALASGGAHLAAPDGGPPPTPVPCGWRPRTGKASSNTFDEWTPTGTKVGWIDGAEAYLQPEAAFAAAQRIGTATNQPLSIAGSTLHLRLHQAGLLRSLDERAGKTRFKIRRVIEGARQTVLHVAAETFIELAGGLSGPPPEAGEPMPQAPAQPQGASGLAAGDLRGESDEMVWRDSGADRPLGPPTETAGQAPSCAASCPWFCDGAGLVCIACQAEAEPETMAVLAAGGPEGGR